MFESSEQRIIIIATEQDSGFDLKAPIFSLEADLYPADTRVLPGVLRPVIEGEVIDETGPEQST